MDEHKDQLFLMGNKNLSDRPLNNNNNSNDSNNNNIHKNSHYNKSDDIQVINIEIIHFLQTRS